MNFSEIRKAARAWEKGPLYWVEGPALKVSISFTWQLEEVKRHLMNRDLFTYHVIVGGPAVNLMPDYFDDVPGVEAGHDYPGVLQMFNHLATKTTTGCVRTCPYCAARKIEGSFRELDDWPDLPVICDNNLLAASQEHFDRVMDRLEAHNWVEFQGIDVRLLEWYHVTRLKRLKKVFMRVALDSMAYLYTWSEALERLLTAGIAKRSIRSYALVGFDDTVEDAWKKCNYIEGQGIKALPMWYHPLDAMERNQVTEAQAAQGWTAQDRKRIMQYFYQHKGEKIYGK